MDRGELSSQARELKNICQRVTKVDLLWVEVVQSFVYGVLALVAFCGAASAELENFQKNIDFAFLSKKRELVKEEQALQERDKKSLSCCYSRICGPVLVAPCPGLSIAS